MRDKNYLKKNELKQIKLQYKKLPKLWECLILLKILFFMCLKNLNLRNKVKNKMTLNLMNLVILLCYTILGITKTKEIYYCAYLT